MGEFDNKAFILDNGRWPKYPLLPVKRYPDEHNYPECGVVLAGHPTVVYLVNLYGIRKDTKLSEVPKLEYSSVDELLADGWVVD